MKVKIYKYNQKTVASLLVIFQLVFITGPVFAQEVPAVDVANTSIASLDQSPDTPSSDAVAPTSDVGTDGTSSTSASLTDSALSSDADVVSDTANENDKDKNGENKDATQIEALSAASDEGEKVNPYSNSYIKVDVDQANGVLNYSYSLKLPAGRNNMTPTVNLTYNSEDKNNNSNFGLGWSLSIPKIERVNKRGTDTLYANNDFRSSLSGDLKYISSNSYGAKVDDGSFLNYQFLNNTWTATTKDGNIYTFGDVANARLSDPNDSSRIYSWYITKIQDTNGNSIVYSYIKAPVYISENEIYIDAISYAGDGSGDGLYMIKFYRDDRPDKYVSYATGFISTITQRIFEIRVLTNGSITRKYNLNYELGDNGSRSMLKSVTETGRDENGITTTMPSLEFSYTPLNNNFVNKSFSFPTLSQYDVNFSDGHIRLMDVNGDGLKDIVKSAYDGGANIFYVLINNGNGWELDNSWTQPTYIYKDTEGVNHQGIFHFETQVVVGDWNGDGKDDLIKFWATPIQGSTGAMENGVVLINTGSGWTQDTSVTFTQNVTYQGNKAYVQSGAGESYFGDLNGDGLMDYVYARNSQTNGINYPTFAVWYNQNGNLVWDNSVELPWTNSINSGYNPFIIGSKVRPFDINNDGLMDFVYASNYQTNGINYPSFWVLLNTGHGWIQDTTISHPIYYNSINKLEYFQTGSGSGWITMDINGDKLPDFAKFNNDGTKYVLINNGHGWTQNDSTITVGQYSYTNTSGTKTGYPYSSSAETVFFDATGDGLDDIINFNWVNSGFENWMLENVGQQANLLLTTNFPEGANYTFGYKATSKYRDVNGNLLNPDFPATYNTLNSLAVNDGLGNVATTTYEYFNGSFYYNNIYDKQVAGFGKVTVIDSAGNKSIGYYHLGNGLQSGETGIDPLDGSLIGKNYKSEFYDSSNTLMSQNYTDWASQDLGNERDFVYTSRMVANEDGKQVAKEYSYNTANGNLTQEINYGKVSAFSDNFSDIDNDKQTVNYVYTTTGPVLPISTETLNQSGSRIKQQKIYYDNQSFGTAIKGNPAKVESWVSGSNYINNQKTYNSYGLPLTETDPNGKVTSYAYDTYNMYPSVVTNALNQQTSYLYNYGVGKPKQVTDVNGFIYQTNYDGLGRIKEEKVPGEVIPSTLTTKTSYQYIDVKNAFSVQRSNYLDTSNVIDSYTYLDGLGRIIQERQATENSGEYAVKDIIYNNLGLVFKESLPYASAGSAKTSATSISQLYNNYSYDALKRITVITNAIGAVSTGYNGWNKTVTDLKSVPKDFSYDAYGNLIQVAEHNGSEVYNTFYEYNGNNNLTKTTDASGNIRNFTYDGIGRRLSAEDLHILTDSSYGAWTYSYNNAGNIVSRTDPNGKIVNYTYDNLNRVISEDYTGSTGIEVSYTYDNCTNGIGKLCQVSSSGVTDSYIYDGKGQVSSNIRTINSNSYQTDYIYNRQGSVITITNPDNSKVQYGYNSAGQLETVQRNESGDAGFTPVVININYNSTGQIIYMSYQNGVVAANIYDQNKLYRLTNKTTTNSTATKLQDISYAYDNNGNITQLIDASQTANKKTANYSYDGLNRLAQSLITNSASGQEDYSMNYNYDAIGNILTRTETIGANPAVVYTYTYTGNNYANPHAVTSISDGANITNYVYDNNGNLLSEGNKAYPFDYNNRLIQSSVPGSGSLPPKQTTTTFSPSAGDGSTYNSNSNWNTARTAASGTSANYTATTFNTRTGKSGSNFLIERSFLPFNTASLPDNATITNVKLKVYVQSKLNNDSDRVNNDWITVVQGSEPSITSLTTADYDLAGTINNPAEGLDSTERKDIANIATGQYLIFNLNSTGKNWVSLIGSTKLALREGHDVINSPFVGSSGQYNQITVRSAEYSGTNYDPILEITYTTPSAPPPATVTNYIYDYQGQRVKVSNGTTATYYPTKNYNTDGTTPTKHIFSGDQSVATITGSNTTSSVHYNNSDYLNSSSIITNSTGSVEELLDYYPYGKIRIDNKVSGYAEQRKFIGQEYDAETGLNYLNARYYDGARGQFVSEDPMFWQLSDVLIWSRRR